MTAICTILGIARRTAYYVARARAGGRRHHRTADETALQQIRAVTNSQATYGYRRVWAMVNRTFRTGYNRKRIRRVMPLHGLMLAPRVHRRHGRPHLGQIQQAASNQRWCSDVFLIPCWSGEVVSVAFAIDCHDREVPAYVASPRPLTGADIRTLMDRTLWARFGEAHAQGATRDPVAQRQRPAVHGDGALRARARPGADHDAGVQPREQRPGRGVRRDLQAGSSRRRRAPRR